MSGEPTAEFFVDGYYDDKVSVEVAHIVDEETDLAFLGDFHSVALGPFLPYGHKPGYYKRNERYEYRYPVPKVEAAVVS